LTFVTCHEFKEFEGNIRIFTGSGNRKSPWFLVK